MVGLESEGGARTGAAHKVQTSKRLLEQNPVVTGQWLSSALQGQPHYELAHEDAESPPALSACTFTNSQIFLAHWSMVRVLCTRRPSCIQGPLHQLNQKVCCKLLHRDCGNLLAMSRHGNGLSLGLAVPFCPVLLLIKLVLHICHKPVEIFHVWRDCKFGRKRDERVLIAVTVRARIFMNFPPAGVHVH